MPWCYVNVDFTYGPHFHIYNDVINVANKSQSTLEFGYIYETLYQKELFHGGIKLRSFDLAHYNIKEHAIPYISTIHLSFI